jgi:beta-glucosidase
LSYTQFEYGEIDLSSPEMNADGNIEVSIPVTNTGKVIGKEVVQLYLGDMIASRTRPVKELKGFQLLDLKPGESRIVKFVIEEKMLQFYTINKIWESEAGEFEVFVGGNSRDVKSAAFNLIKNKA